MKKYIILFNVSVLGLLFGVILILGVEIMANGPEHLKQLFSKPKVRPGDVIAYRPGNPFDPLTYILNREALAVSNGYVQFRTWYSNGKSDVWSWDEETWRMVKKAQAWAK